MQTRLQATKDLRHYTDKLEEESKKVEELDELAKVVQAEFEVCSIAQFARQASQRLYSRTGAKRRKRLVNAWRSLVSPRPSRGRLSLFRRRCNNMRDSGLISQRAML